LRRLCEELQIDYEDLLRSRKLPIWEKSHRFVTRLRELNRSAPDPDYDTFRKAIEHENPEICANGMITLIKITTYLLKRQIKHLEATFLLEGGLRERMTKARIKRRNKEE
jgi:four helix bundle suffix protein